MREELPTAPDGYAEQIASIRMQAEQLQPGDSRRGKPKHDGGPLVGMERRPVAHRGWEERTPTIQSEFDAVWALGNRAFSMWHRQKLRVMSRIVEVDADAGPEWCLSVMRVPRARATDENVERVLRDFGMAAAIEDNRMPTWWRDFFLPLDASKRALREAVIAEREGVVEADGYRWTRDPGGTCAGCVLFLATQQPCPVHGATAHDGSR